MVIDPAEFSDEELQTYLKELFDATDELNASAISIRVAAETVYLTGDVPDAQQRDLAQMLVLDLVPEDRIVNDLLVIPEVDTEPESEPPDEPPVDVGEVPTEVETEDPEHAAQEGETYEPPVAPVPEPKHDVEW